ncbi:MAG: imidazolonepropionase, partial [Thermoproteota archaeon]|nr:imidazolonepropionase [Thermoproteota archaeon]
MAKEKVDLLITNANELVTLKGKRKNPAVGKHMKNLGIILNGGVAIHEGKIVAVDKTQKIKSRFQSENTVDARGKLVTPGFVDSHTHLVFAGSREEEFEMRIQGANYMEILEMGGGILKTVRETRKASEEELLKKGEKTLNIMLEHGTTTVEAKSGYGLTTKDEVKCLEVIKRLDQKHPVNVVSTFLGAHTVPPEYKNKADDYVKLVAEEMIPTVANRNLAEFCDVFCEKSVFTVEQSRKILLRGKEHGLKLKLHADEMSWTGGAELAAEVGAVSAEHLLFASKNGIKAMAEKGVIGVLLPAASFSLMTNRWANARKMIQEGVAVALGTDYNPSCWTENLQLVIALACRQMRMTPAEAITAVTINSTHSINKACEV